MTTTPPSQPSLNFNKLPERAIPTKSATMDDIHFKYGEATVKLQQLEARNAELQTVNSFLLTQVAFHRQEPAQTADHARLERSHHKLHREVLQLRAALGFTRQARSARKNTWTLRSKRESSGRTSLLEEEYVSTEDEELQFLRQSQKLQLKQAKESLVDSFDSLVDLSEHEVLVSVPTEAIVEEKVESVSEKAKETMGYGLANLKVEENGKEGGNSMGHVFEIKNADGSVANVRLPAHAESKANNAGPRPMPVWGDHRELRTFNPAAYRRTLEFGDGEHNRLSGQAWIIEDFNEEELNEFWLRKARESGHRHSAKEWREYYEEKIRPAYLEKELKRSMEAEELKKSMEVEEKKPHAAAAGVEEDKTDVDEKVSQNSSERSALCNTHLKEGFEEMLREREAAAATVNDEKVSEESSRDSNSFRSQAGMPEGSKQLVVKETAGAASGTEGAIAQLSDTPDAELAHNNNTNMQHDINVQPASIMDNDSSVVNTRANADNVTPKLNRADFAKIQVTDRPVRGDAAAKQHDEKLPADETLPEGLQFRHVDSLDPDDPFDTPEYSPTAQNNGENFVAAAFVQPQQVSFVGTDVNVLLDPLPGLGNLPEESIRAAFGPRVSVVQPPFHHQTSMKRSMFFKQIPFDGIRLSGYGRGYAHRHDKVKADAATSKEHVDIETCSPNRSFDLSLVPGKEAKSTSPAPLQEEAHALCSVMIEVHPSINILTALSKVRIEGGSIVCASYMETSQLRTKPLSKVNRVLLIFLSESVAKNFVQQSKEKPVFHRVLNHRGLHQNFRVTATLVESATRPIPPNLLCEINEKNLSRVLYVIAPSGIRQWRNSPLFVALDPLLLCQCLVHGNSDFTAPLCYYANAEEGSNDGKIILEFASMGDAKQAWDMLDAEKDQFGDGFSFGFEKDPCGMEN